MRWSGARQVFGIDLRTLAFFRVCLACLLLGDLADRALDLGAHYSDAGVLPRLLLLDSGEWRPSLHMLSGSIIVQAALFLLAALCASALLFGYRTRLATAACWFLTLSLQARNPLVFQGGDLLILVFLFWSIFLPLGARFSIDAALATNKISDNRYFSIATLALLFQCMYVYFFGALLKTGDTWLAEGTAVAYAMHVDSYATPFALMVRDFSWLTQSLTYFIWYLEILAPFLMFSPIFHIRLRTVTLMLLIVLHLGFFVFLKVGIFPFASITSLLLFIPGVFWDWLERRLPVSRAVVIYYDEPCDFCRKVCLLLRTFLLLPQATIVPAQSHPDIGSVLERENSWVVTDEDETQYLRWDAMILLVQRSPLFRPLASLLRLGFAYRLGARVYDWVARNRGLLGRFSGRYLPYRIETYRLPAPISVLVGVLFGCVLYYNTVLSPAFPYRWPNYPSPIVKTLFLHQSWKMFAPDPPKSDYWYLAVGELANGDRVDLLRSMPDPDYEKPEDLSDFFSRHRWRWYYWRLLNDVPTVGPHLFARYLCDRWNADHTNERQAFRINLSTMIQPVTLGATTEPMERRQLVDEECSILRIQPKLEPAAL